MNRFERSNFNLNLMKNSKLQKKKKNVVKWITVLT